MLETDLKNKMKKYMLLIISIIILILSFLNSWFYDVLFDSLFVLGLIPSVILIISWILCFVFSILKLIKNKELLNILSLVIVVFTAFLILFFPFRKNKVKLELEFFEEGRLEIIQMVEDDKLEIDALGNAKLPDKYKQFSNSGEIVVYQNDLDDKLIAFWVFRGMQSGSVQLIYSTGGEKLIRDNETGHSIVSVDKLKDNWYYVVTDY